MSNVIPFRPFLPADAVVVTYPLHFDPVIGLDWIKKRNPDCGILMSTARPTNDARILTLSHVAIEGELTAREVVETLWGMPKGASIALRRL